MQFDRSVLTLEEFRKMELRQLPQATGELSNLLRDIALAAKRVSSAVNRAGLMDILGPTGQTNVQGEAVQRLDDFANDQFMGALQRGVSCAGIASEELDDFVAFDEALCNQSKYVCVFDPLDGSGNIDVDMSIGSIFGVYRRLTERGKPCERADFLQPGRQLVAAGYIIYGPSVILVYATRRGVNGFTLDPAIGEFTLSHPDIHCPHDGASYSVNHGNFYLFEKRVQDYISSCQQKAVVHGGPYSQRYTGCMVADIHRSLLKGGVFMYPATNGKLDGKLRLGYECNPFAFIMDIAGGSATNGTQPILDIQPKSLHERSPLFIGSKAMMGEAAQFLHSGTHHR